MIMGVSTDGLLVYGYSYDEGHEFPWKKYDEEDEYLELEPEEWWEKASPVPFKPSFYPYDEYGEYKQGVLGRDDPRIDGYYEEKRAWEKANPFPIDVVYHCSYDYPMFILAVKSFSASRGYPVPINPLSDLNVDSVDMERLDRFVDEYIGRPNEPAGWWLASMWG